MPLPTNAAVAGPSLDEAQKGIVLAGFLKLLMPLIIVVPGIAAVLIAPGLDKPDDVLARLDRAEEKDIRAIDPVPLRNVAYVGGINFSDHNFDWHD